MKVWSLQPNQSTKNKLGQLLCDKLKKKAVKTRIFVANVTWKNNKSPNEQWNFWGTEEWDIFIFFWSWAHGGIRQRICAPVDQVLDLLRLLAGIRRGLDSFDEVSQKSLEASFAPISQTSLKYVCDGLCFDNNTEQKGQEFKASKEHLHLHLHLVPQYP